MTKPKHVRVAHIQNLRRAHIWWGDFFSDQEKDRLMAEMKVNMATKDLRPATKAITTIRELVRGVDKFVRDLQTIAQTLAKSFDDWENHFHKNEAQRLHRIMMTSHDADQLLDAIRQVRTVTQAAAKPVVQDETHVETTTVAPHHGTTLIPDEFAPDWLRAARANTLVSA